MSSSRITELSQRIAANTTKVDDYYTSRGLPEPSFAVDAPLTSVIPESEVEVFKARQAVINDTLELRRLMLGPREHLSGFSVSSGIERDKPLRLTDEAASHHGGRLFFNVL